MKIKERKIKEKKVGNKKAKKNPKKCGNTLEKSGKP